MIRFIAFLTLLPALLTCDTGTPTDSGVSGIYRHSGNQQQGAVGTLLKEELVVLVADGDGTPAPERTVTFEVVEGVARITAESDITDRSGLASTRLILGTTPGNVLVRAAAVGISHSVVFTATAVLPGELDSTGAPGVGGIHRHSGDGQEGVVGTLLQEELVVVVVGDDGAPMSGRLVLFEVAEGSARLTAETDVTDGVGRAAVRLILGATPGSVVIRATTPGVQDTVHFAVTSVVPEQVNAPADSGLDDYALHFDSARRHEVYVGLVSTTGDQYTVEAWIRLPEVIPPDFESCEIVGQHASYADAKGTLDILHGRLRLLINMDEEEHHELLSSDAVPRGEWTHVAGVYDGHEMRLYIGGVEVGSVPAVGNITGYNQRRSTRIGGYAGTATEPYWFSGDIDEVRIWDVARAPDQLRADMYHHIDAQSGLIGYWPFDDGGGLSATDESGHGHDGELTSFQGSGYPRWVPGVFTEIDSTGP